ncbi:MAG: ABC transporter substrate-binding protein [Candidatus Paracaedimonas acanthamoebae]|uniref:ABC transporter substrate-binding protein n=1 Tax=Candidatus Paracaedimonas acanthamoebae TaxID=244581 RepID=A0A8J7PZZ3_9PROT|nr:ABC transporter substrate-binding protein [Candidatus Paracaedimonas acanthamoebae]
MTHFYYRAVCIILLNVLFSSENVGKEHGIAMHGTLKYSINFKHFSTVNPEAPKGGKLRLGVTGIFDSLNPYVIKGTPPAGLSIFSERLVFDTLMKRSPDEPFSLYGLIAESVDLASDRSSIIFYLNPKAKWPNAQSITADDVIFSFETLKEKGLANYRLFFKKVSKVEKINSHTIKFSFLPDKDDNVFDPEAPLLICLLPILPKYFFEGRDFEKVTHEEIPGSGPYKIKHVKLGHMISYERRPDYWGKDLPVNVGFYNFAEVRFDYYRDSKIALEAFKVGEYDIRGESEPTQWIKNYNFPAVKDGKIVKIEFNHQRPVGIKAFIFNIRKNLFNNESVRRALTYAFDFEWLNQSLFHNCFTRTMSYFDNTMLANDGIPQGNVLKLLQPFKNSLPAELFSTPYSLPLSGTKAKLRENLKKARDLLQANGWEIHGCQLIHKKTRQPFKFEIILYKHEDEKIALAYIKNLKLLGIQATIRTVDSTQYEHRLGTFDYDMTIHTWGHTLSPGNEQNLYWNSKTADQKGSRNYIGIKNPTIDKLCRMLVNAKTHDELTTITKALDLVLLWGHYLIPLYHSNKIFLAYWDKFGHPQFNPLDGIVLMNWWSKELKKK